MADGEARHTDTQIDALRQRASLFARSTDVTRDDMSLSFEPTWATDLELLVGGAATLQMKRAPERIRLIRSFDELQMGE